MRSRTLALAAASGAALLCAVALPATAQPASVRGGRAADASARPDGAAVGAAELLAKVQTCAQISHGKYRTDPTAEATVPVCGKNGAVFWQADLDVDCDGQATAACNKATDPWFQPDTRFHQSNDKPLSAEKVSYVVVPNVSPLWNYSSSGIRGGGVVAVVYNDRVEYAVVGDTGPGTVIGEASYATAKALGMNPSPKTGGAESGVTYILFQNSQAKPIESHGEAVAVGRSLAQRFVADN
ncbi:glycoside hydrolase family 75 protein [Streptomyces sp. NPDC056670]|uniref:glycoside hydrolase family 75 protein n=1 Tax=unclassified Streptomyces TaxID=2593676 RepID=UPI0036C4FC23